MGNIAQNFEIAGGCRHGGIQLFDKIPIYDNYPIFVKSIITSLRWRAVFEFFLALPRLVRYRTAFARECPRWSGWMAVSGAMK
jgi:hypothetical protein